MLISKCDTDLQDHGYFHEDLQEKKVLKMQTGVFRTNCLDSLDRTNVAQSKVALFALQSQLKLIGVNLLNVYGADMAKSGLAFSVSPNPVDPIQ